MLIFYAQHYQLPLLVAVPLKPVAVASGYCAVASVKDHASVWCRFLLGAMLLTICFWLSEYDPSGRDYYYFAAAANGIQNGCAAIYE